MTIGLGWAPELRALDVGRPAKVWKD